MTTTDAGASPVDCHVRPAVTYCPYCGSSSVREVKNVPRCDKCRAVFFVNFSRYVRRSPLRAKTAEEKVRGMSWLAGLRA